MKSSALRTQNVTLSLPRQTLRKAKLVAVERDTSLSRLLVDLIENMVSSEDRYDRARRQHLMLLDQARDLGTKGRPVATREELHER